MALVKEPGDGTNPDANAYIDVTEAQNILTDFGYTDFPSETDIIQATLYVDTYLNPVSTIVEEEQPLLWPREKFIDNQGREVKEIPFELKRATAMISAEFMENDLFNVSPKITEESYGDSSVTYAGAVSQETTRVNTALLRLKRLGYGSGVSTIILSRA